ncbi:hypothetical protein TIFTF001_034711 [Ficus carica]|uniref:Uncharacterized protein n=1 Tax=Ficus carica TaxID=3494 RepID=A0AA88E0E0_FICCA|nr:hypothetical protein TIFTF001_034711 [Ficus carica]
MMLTMESLNQEEEKLIMKRIRNHFLRELEHEVTFPFHSYGGGCCSLDYKETTDENIDGSLNSKNVCVNGQHLCQEAVRFGYVRQVESESSGDHEAVYSSESDQEEDDGGGESNSSGREAIHSELDDQEEN